MNAAQDISLLSMLFVLLLLAVPLGIGWYLQLGVNRRLLVSAGRMAGQLALVGVYLKYLFDLNNTAVTLVWLLVMVVFASFSVIRNSELSRRIFALPATAALILTTGFLLGYFNALIIRLDNVFEARYVIAIGGMLLGNAMRGTIFGVSDFYRNIHRNENRYRFRLALGATVFEASREYLRGSLNAALKPSLASMATMGIVFIPGMMTGQIIGGSTPVTAIKYQIAIMIVIYTATMMSIGLTILFTMRASFDGFGLLKSGVFSRKPSE